MLKLGNVHLRYIAKLLRENKIAFKITKSDAVQITVYVGSKRKDNELMDLSVGDDSDVDRIWLNLFFGELVDYHLDDLSNPNAYIWLIEYIKHSSKIFIIHKQWGIP